MISLCTEYYQFFLAQGLLLGLSMSFLIIPSLATVTWYFTKNRGLAAGVTISGSSLGGVIWPIVLDHLLHHDNVSFGWTIRIVGFIMVPILTMVFISVRPPLKVASINTNDETNIDSPRKHKTDLSIAKDPVFVLFCVGAALFNLAMTTPFFFVTSYATRLGKSVTFGSTLVSLLNAASLFGRIIPGILADRYGCFNGCSLAALLSGVIVFSWTTAESSGGLIVWCLSYGFASGALLSLQMTCVSHISTPQTRGTALGIAMGPSALA
jgi:MFS family permease